MRKLDEIQIQKIREIPKTTVKTTTHLIKWAFLVIILYIIVTTVYGFYSQGLGFLDNVVTLSVGGFFAFFMGYFGWRLAESMEIWFTQK